MRHLNEYIKESLFDVDDRDLDKTIKDEIEKYIKSNYNTKQYSISKTPGEDGKYVVNSKGNISVKNKEITNLTNDLFVWGKVGGYFICIECASLKTLEGAPKEVGGGFNCGYCESLTSLNGAPKKVGTYFNCSYCGSLTSLNGAPAKVGGYFLCIGCDSLKTLEGSPKEVGSDFDCHHCESLTSLNGAPTKVKGYFDCEACKIQFTEDDVRKVSKVDGKIRC